MSERTEMKGSDRSSTISAFTAVMVVVAQLGGVLIGIGAVAYLIGHNYLSAYFGAAKTPWALAYFTSDKIVREGVGIASVVAIAFFWSFIELMNGSLSSKSLEKFSKWLALIALVPLVAAIAGPYIYLSAKVSSLLSIIAGISFAASAGTTLGELVARLKDSNSEWKGHHLTLILFIYLFAVSQAPSVTGRAKAEIDMSVDGSSLPYISKEGETAGEWRMVRPLGDRFLIVALEKEASARRFKLVSVDESWVISQKKPEP
jgi:hypothetical protein